MCLWRRLPLATPCVDVAKSAGARATFLKAAFIMPAHLFKASFQKSVEAVSKAMDLTKWYLGLVPYVETYLSTTPNVEATASYGGELCVALPVALSQFNLSVESWRLVSPL